MYTKFIAVVLVTLTPVVASAARGVTTSRYANSDNPAGGVVYALPRTLLKLDVTYTLTETTHIVEGRTAKVETRVLIEKPVKVTAVTAPDERQRFVVTGDTVSRNPFVASTFEFKLDDAGSLVSAGGTIDDKTLDAVQSLVSAGVQVAKIAVAAGSAIPPNDPLKPIVQRIAAIYNEIAQTSASNDAKKLPKLKALRDELDALRGVVQNYNDTNKTVAATRDFAYTVTIDPQDFSWNEADEVYEYSVRPDNLINEVPAERMPDLKIRLLASKTTFEKASKQPAVEKKRGIVYRSGVPVVIEVTANAPSNVILRDVVSFAQFGDLAVAPLNRKLFTSQNTTLLMSGGTGGLKEYKVVSGSSADGAASKLASSLDSVRGSLLDIQYGIELEELKKKKELLDAQKALEPAPGVSAAEQRLAELKKEKELLEAELAVLKAKQDLEKAKNPAP